MKTIRLAIVGALALLLSTSVFAAPPAPELPTGACAGLFKKNTLVAFPPSVLADLAPDGIGAPNISVYVDFDNNLYYLSATREFASDSTSADDWTTADVVQLADGEPFTLSVSDTHAFALEFVGSFTFEGEEEEINALLIPTNSGTTFFVQVMGSPEAGVCQKI